MMNVQDNTHDYYYTAMNTANSMLSAKKLYSQVLSSALGCEATKQIIGVF